MNTLTIYESTAIKYLRAVATVLIVACHFSQAFNNHWAYVFDIGVPLFFVMSGYLYGFKQIESWDSFFFKRWKKLYIPYIIFFVFIVLALKLFHIEKIRLDEVIKVIYICHGYIGTAFTGAGQIWFITAIFACYWITPILQKITSFLDGRYVGAILILLGLMTFLLLTFSFSTSPVARWYSWFFNYAVGYFLSRSKESIKYIYLGISTLFLIIVLSILSWGDLLNWNTWISVSFHAFSAHVVFLAFILGSKVLKPIKVLIPVSLIEVYSYYIYFVHYPFTLGPWSIIGATNNLALDIILLVIVVAICTAILFYLSKYVEKALDWVLANNNKASNS